MRRKQWKLNAYLATAVLAGKDVYLVIENQPTVFYLFQPNCSVKLREEWLATFLTGDFRLNPLTHPISVHQQVNADVCNRYHRFMQPVSRYTSILLSLLASSMLVYAVLGDPSAGYFQFLKFAVLGSSLYVSLAIYQRSEKLAPLSVCLTSLGALEAFGKMGREEWSPWNLGMVGVFAISIIVLLWKPKSHTPSLDKSRGDDVHSDELDLVKDEVDSVASGELNVYDAIGRKLSTVRTLPGERPVIETSEETRFDGIAAGVVLSLANTLSHDDQAILARWAGLTRNAWTDEHQLAFTAALLHHVKDGTDGKYKVPDCVSDFGKGLSGDRLPLLPVPLTPEVRTMLNRMFGD